jgi:hypothetical protein
MKMLINIRIMLNSLNFNEIRSSLLILSQWKCTMDNEFIIIVTIGNPTNTIGKSILKRNFIKCDINSSNAEKMKIKTKPFFNKLKKE